MAKDSTEKNVPFHSLASRYRELSVLQIKYEHLIDVCSALLRPWLVHSWCMFCVITNPLGLAKILFWKERSRLLILPKKVLLICIPCGLVVRIQPSHGCGRGSIPRMGIFFCCCCNPSFFFFPTFISSRNSF